ncbi:MAG: AI-2E family transporter, partial [Phycisphaerae bacterium]|nr:AI-2E family transporter [Phycisphaerae bacterium]
IINYFLISLFLALVSASPVFWLQRKGLPIGISIISVTLIIVTAIIFLAGVLGSSLTSFSASLPEYQVRLSEHIAPLKG